jgi:hypothetical protein
VPGKPAVREKEGAEIGLVEKIGVPGPGGKIAVVKGPGGNLAAVQPQARLQEPEGLEFHGGAQDQVGVEPVLAGGGEIKSVGRGGFHQLVEMILFQ